MAISFIGASEFSNGIATVSSAPLATPAGTANGDLMIAHIVIRDEAQTITAPAGWTQIAVAVNEADHEMRWYEHTASSEPASRSWTFSGNTATACGLVVLRGAVNPHGSSVSDGLALLSHPTNNVTTLGPGAWLLGGWSCQAILTVGWTAPGTMTERTESIGGLVLVLNAEEMTATEGPVSVGTYSRTATTLDPINGISSLLAVEAIIDPLLASPILGVASVPSGTMTLGLLPTPILTTSSVPSGTLTLGLLPNPVNGVASLPSATLELGLLASPLDAFASVSEAALLGFELLATPIDGAGLLASGAVVPGEVFLTGSPLDLFSTVPSGTVTPGEVFLGHMPWLQPQDQGVHTLIPGEVFLDGTGSEIFYSLDFAAQQQIMFGFLLSNEDPAFGVELFDPGEAALMTIHIGGGGFAPPAGITTFQLFPPFGMIFIEGEQFHGPCCST